MAFELQVRRVTRRGSLYEGGDTQFTWERAPMSPTFDTQATARRWYLERMDPELRGKPDDFLLLHWKSGAYRQQVRCRRLNKRTG